MYILFCLGVGATCSQDSGQILKTRLCGGAGIFNTQKDQTVLLTSVFHDFRAHTYYNFLKKLSKPLWW